MPDLAAKPSKAALPQSVSPRPGTYALLDAVRGLACLWVVEFHALGFLAAGDTSMGNNSLFAVGLNGALGVWIFFVVSGYCIANTAVASLARNRRDWGQARVRRIFPPCWFASIFCLASTFLAESLVSHGVLKSSNLANAGILHKSWWFYLTNLTLTQRLFNQPNLSGVYWTLCYEVAFYTVVGLLLWIHRRFGNASLLLNSLHSVTVLSIAGILWWPMHSFYPFDLWPHFGLGVLLYHVVCHGWQRFVSVCALLSLLGIAVFILQHHQRIDYVDAGGGISLLTATLSAVILFGLHRFDRYVSRLGVVRLLSWLGVFSYSLYLTHTLVIGYVYKACLMTGILPAYLPLYVVLAVLACLGFAQIFFRFCEHPFLGGRRTREVAPLVKDETQRRVPA